MKIVVAPDSFKGTLTATEAAQCMADGVRQSLPDTQIISIPLADGGDGTVDAFAAALPGSRKVTISVTGPLNSPAQASYLLFGETAVVEMAQASGLTLVSADMRNPCLATTFGTGELIAAALSQPQVKRLIIGLGGSATVDGGAGAMQALGVRFFGEDGEMASPITGGVTGQVKLADSAAGLKLGTGQTISIACDVTNPLTGITGAAGVYGPQKGATPAMVELLDQSLKHFALILDKVSIARGGKAGVSVSPGAGAAGGLAAGLLALFPSAVLRSGIEIVLDAVGFVARCEGADLVLTGEGRLDNQTMSGKAIFGVVRSALRAGSPVVAFAGSLDPGVAARLQSFGLREAYSLEQAAGSLEAAKANAAKVLTECVARAMASSSPAA